ncbi:MAG: hypothetical protein IJE23_03970 [Tyzzerella sp.]|nr:hypothetical protein [Tyzzerella sp.]
MSITFNKDNNIFYLNNEKCTYAFCIDSAFAPIVNESERSSSLDVIPQEYPIYGMGDFRETAVLIRTQSGNRVTNF